jgi:hypothetical protein
MVNKNMDEKDITKLLGIKGKIRLSGKKTFVMAKKAIFKFKSNRAKKLATMKEFVKDEATQVAYDKNIKDLEKVNNLKQARETLMEKAEKSDEDKILIDELDSAEKKIENKVVKRLNKGLGIFTINKLYIKKLLTVHKEARKSKKFNTAYEKTILDLATDYVTLQDVQNKYNEISNLFIEMNERDQKGENVNISEYTKRLDIIAKEKDNKIYSYQNKKQKFMDFCKDNGMEENDINNDLKNKIQIVVKTIEEDNLSKEEENEDIQPKAKKEVDKPYNGYSFGIVENETNKEESMNTTSNIQSENNQSEFDNMLKQIGINVTNSNEDVQIPFGNGHSTR